MVDRMAQRGRRGLIQVKRLARRLLR